MKTKKSVGKKRVCGLCGNTRKRLTKTDCCGKWICDDEDEYVMFSYARNSCSRNHRRYTLCGFHSVEEHEGDWKTCKECRESFDTEDYVWYGTNEYNFEILPNPPEFKPTRCGQCDRVIHRGNDGYTSLPDGTFLCEQCGEEHMHVLAQQSRTNVSH